MGGMNDISQLRRDLRTLMTATNLSQSAVSKASGVDQASLSRFLRENNPEGLSGGAVLRLIPLVYDLPSPCLSPLVPPPSSSPPAFRQSDAESLEEV
jgi:transcriptional regulator with XRE-family HTH domain